MEAEESADAPLESAQSAAPAIAHIMSNERAGLLAASLQALSSPTRLRLLSFLVHVPEGEATVSQLTAQVQMKQPTVTRHLNLLHDAGIVQRERRGRQTWYWINVTMQDMIEDLVL